MTLKDFIDYKIIHTENISSVYHKIGFWFNYFHHMVVVENDQEIDKPKIKKAETSGGSRYAVFQILKYFVWVIVAGIALETINHYNLLIAKLNLFVSWYWV
ncbi:MAG: hypothetical protein R2764_03745 [Bacteroidales bacterium]